MQTNDRQYSKNNRFYGNFIFKSCLGLILSTSSANAASESSATTASAVDPASGSNASTNTAPTRVSSIKKTANKSIVKTSSPIAKSPQISIKRISTNGATSARNAEVVSNVSDTAVSEMKVHAVELEKSGKLEEAQQLLAKVTDLRPDDKASFDRLSDIAVNRAQDALKANKFDVALLATRQALSASPNNQQANQILSKLYTHVGADPNNVSNRLKTADALFQQGRLHEAEVEYQASLAVKLSPDAYVGLGKVADKLQEPGAGRSDYERALEVDPNSAAAHREMGRLYLSNGDLVGANTELSRALILNSSDKAAGDALTKLWHDQINLKPDGNSHLGLARAYQLQGNLSAAQSEYKEVVRIDPKNPALTAARQSFKIALVKTAAANEMSAAKTLEAQGRLLEAYNKTCTANGYSPDNSEYMLYQGQVLEKMGQLPVARQVYLRILEFDPQNSIAVQRIKQMPYAPGQQASPGAAVRATRTQVSGFPGSRFPLAENEMAGTASGTNTQLGVLSSFVGQVRNTMMAKDNALGDDGFSSAKGGRAAMAAIAPSLSAPPVAAPVPVPIIDRPLTSVAASADASANGVASPASSDEFLASMLVEPVPYSVPAQPLAVGAHGRKVSQTNHSIAWVRSRGSHRAPSSLSSAKMGASQLHKTSSQAAASNPHQTASGDDTSGGARQPVPAQDTIAPTQESASPSNTPPPKADPGGLFAGSDFN